MRRAFATALAELAANDDRILLLTGDLGYMALEPFADVFPERFLNVGVAEHNMAGIATGLAEAGFLPYTYSIATFASLRPLEMIRNGPIAHGLPVRIVGVGGGFEYGQNGISHYPIEDVGIMRIQPALTVIAPADHRQARTAILQTADLRGPIYYRLGKDDVTLVEGLDGRFELGRVEVIRSGSDVVLVALGAAALEAAAAADRLERDGISPTVAVVASFNPAPVADLVDLFSRHVLAVTVEAHYINGALGSLAAETIAEEGLDCRLVRCGVVSMPDGRSGTQAYLHALHGIGAEQIQSRVVTALS